MSVSLSPNVVQEYKAPSEPVKETLTYHNGDVIQNVSEMVTDLCHDTSSGYLLSSTLSGMIHVYDFEDDRNVDSFRLQPPAAFLHSMGLNSADASGSYTTTASTASSSASWNSASVGGQRYRPNLGQQQQQLGSTSTSSKASAAPAPRKKQRPLFECSTFDIRNDLIFAGSMSGLTGLWRCKSHEPVAMWQDHADKITAAQWVTDEDVYTTSYDGFFRVRNLAHNELVHSFVACACPISAFAVEHPDSVFLGGWDGTVKRLDLRQRECAAILKPSEHDSNPIRCFALGTVPAAVAPAKPEAEGKKKKVPEAPKDPVTLFVSHGMGEIKAWDLRNLKVSTGGFVGHSEVVTSMALSAGRLFSAADDGVIRIFDASRGNHLETLRGHDQGITAMKIAAGGWLISGSYDQTIRQYSLVEIHDSISRRQAAIAAAAAEAEAAAIERAKLLEEAAAKKKSKKKAKKAK